MFKKAERKQVRARIALVGPPGAGKTYTALRTLKHMGCTKIAVIDTERGSASKYAGDPELPPFDVCELETFSPTNYVKAIKAAGEAGYDGLIIDSASHAWNGDGGILDTVSKSGKNGFEGWAKVKPLEHEWVDAVLTFPGHLVATYRTKNEYSETENDKGKKSRQKVGLAPITREGMEYEFDIVGYLDDQNVLHIDKTRCPALTDQHFRKPGEQFAAIVKTWCEDGAAFDVAACVAVARTCNTMQALKAWADEYRTAVNAQPPAVKAQIVAARTEAVARIEAAAAEEQAKNGLQSTEAA